MSSVPTARVGPSAPTLDVLEALVSVTVVRPVLPGSLATIIDVILGDVPVMGVPNRHRVTGTPISWVRANQLLIVLALVDDDALVMSLSGLGWLDRHLLVPHR